MKVIHKFLLASDGSETNLRVKNGFKIVHSEYVVVDKAIYIWVEQTLAIDVPELEITFKVVRSGQPIQDHMVHIATAVDSLAPEAYHIIRAADQNLKAAQLNFSFKQPDAA